MSDCCSTSCDQKTAPGKHTCPSNGIAYAQVSVKTILHHITKPWEWAEKEQTYYFCDAPDCDVVYFGDDNSVIRKSELRTLVGVKEKVPHAPLCYCFGVSKADAAANPMVKNFVLQKTKEVLCSCETSNPSGRCCLKDFPKQP